VGVGIVVAGTVKVVPGTAAAGIAVQVLAVPTASPSSSLSRLLPGRQVMKSHPPCPSLNLLREIIMESRVFSCRVRPKMVLFCTS
jgi:hypothetical protein